MGFYLGQLSGELKTGAEIILKERGLLGGKTLIVANRSDKFRVRASAKKVEIDYTVVPEFFRGLGYAIAKRGRRFTVEESCAFDDYGYMVDLSRNGVMTVEAIKKNLRQLALMGYRSVQLYTEDTYEVRGEPYFGYLRGRMTVAELKALDEYASLFGIELVPCIQTLGHLSRLFRWRRFYEVCDGYDVLLPGDERTYQLLDKMFATLRECFRTNRINISMDETSSVALGAYWDKHGPTKDRLEVFTAHLQRVNEIAGKYGFQFPMMWSDVFFWIEEDSEIGTGKKPVSEHIRKRVPENVTLVNWCYWNSPDIKAVLKSHLTFNRDVCYAGTIWRFGSPAPHNKISMNYLRYQIDACKEIGIKKFLLTAWGDNGNECAYFAGLVTQFLSIEYAYGNSEEACAERFERLFGCSVENMFKLDYANFCKDYPDVVSRHSKYMLYSGYFENDYLRQVNEEYAADCAGYAKELRAAAKSAGEWKYLFRTQAALCELLSIKIAVAQKTRRLYLAGDKGGMARLIESDYLPLKKCFKRFADEMRAQWMRECKPHGFDVIEQRLGGMLLRTDGAIERLQAWIEGTTERIFELEEEVLSYVNPNYDFKPIKQGQFEEIYSQYRL
ncbi:MAG: beta-N-acetylhexosaminidase [Clostridia bacterium]|nr:beta-N-acetylhexosaminidase [Clostridia bacterium]